MRVTCNSINAFLDNLKPIKHDNIFGSVVYVDTDMKPVDNQDKRKAIKFLVVIIASAVVDLPTGQYLLVAGEECGFDLIAEGGYQDGSDKALELKRMIGSFCDTIGVSVQSGIVSE
jgi:hypothetical protein